MGILHLCFDGNFINNSLKVFEKYYPGQNLFIVNKEKKDFQMLQDDERLLGIPLEEEDFPKVHQLCIEHHIDKIIIHGIKPSFVDCLQYLKKDGEFKVYWIFWGYELYFALGQLGKYKLVDGGVNPFLLQTYYSSNRYSYFVKRIWYGKKVFADLLKKFLPMVDYFCFWNYKDYELLQSYFHTDIKYKFFAYAAYTGQEEPGHGEKLPARSSRTIMINHQASNTGNHCTIMNKIASLDAKNSYKKIVPLSYGSPRVRNHVLKIGKKLFASQFQPIFEYMPRDEYFALITSVEVAVFGARRQEASGNISTLLRNGVKVFLRENNNLLQYYKEKGYILFSFENDLHSMEDLKPLTVEEQKHNKECSIKNRILYDQFMPSFFNE